MGKRVAILGSTGSIGCSTLEVLEHLGDAFTIVALSANQQEQKLLEQCQRFQPSVAVLCEPATNPQAFASAGVDFKVGADALCDIVTRDDVDIVVAAIVGAAGLPAVLAAVDASKRVCLANKEALVVAGSLVMPLAKKRNATLLPVDSEHSAIFQAMQSGRRSEVQRVFLTASGGPFRQASAEQIYSATLKDALNHPTWSMGSKITIDSATMFNKGLELIEACWLFDLDPGLVEVVVHPESVIHSMVEFVDGSTVAQMSPPDMKTPIQYAITWPERLSGVGSRMDFAQAQSLHFEPPDLNRFPALQLAYDAARAGGTAGAVLNAANEEAVQQFLAGNIAFGQISEMVSRVTNQHDVQPVGCLDDLLQADAWARTAFHNNLLTPSSAS